MAIDVAVNNLLKIKDFVKSYNAAEEGVNEMSLTSAILEFAKSNGEHKEQIISLIHSGFTPEKQKTFEAQRAAIEKIIKEVNA